MSDIVRNFTVTLVRPDSSELNQVIELGRANSATLGFFPEGAFAEHARAGQVIACVDAKGTVEGYLLFRVTANRAVLVHLCVSKFARGKGIARKLFQQLIESGPHYRCQCELWCRQEWAG